MCGRKQNTDLWCILTFDFKIGLLKKCKLVLPMSEAGGINLYIYALIKVIKLDHLHAYMLGALLYVYLNHDL